MYNTDYIQTCTHDAHINIMTLPSLGAGRVKIPYMVDTESLCVLVVAPIQSKISSLVSK